MSKVIAVFGAGAGRGVALARRFGREGFRVALVARRKDRLEELAEELRRERIEATAFPADLGDPAGVPALISAWKSRASCESRMARTDSSKDLLTSLRTVGDMARSSSHHVRTSVSRSASGTTAFASPHSSAWAAV